MGLGVSKDIKYNNQTAKTDKRERCKVLVRPQVVDNTRKAEFRNDQNALRAMFRNDRSWIITTNIYNVCVTACVRLDHCTSNTYR